jgi:tripartite-type tricarboxylate transporter receptor subunit TctC
MRRRGLIAAAGLAAAPAPARADTPAWPTRPVRIIVPFAPGGSGDITARLVGAHIEARTGQPAVVDSRPGANGVIGTVAVKAAAPDGYTLLLATTSTHAANPSLVRNLAYDPERDFHVVGVFGNGGSYLFVRPESPWRSVAELVAAAKAAPGRVFFGYFNASSRVPAELLNHTAGIQMQGVPYRAIGAAFTDLFTGRLQVIFVDTAAGDAFLRNGQVRALAVTRAQRWDRHPELPAMAESYPGFVMGGFLGLAVPAGTPVGIQQRLNTLVNEAILIPPMRPRLEEFGFTPVGMTLDECAAHVRGERETWARTVRLAGIEPE